MPGITSSHLKDKKEKILCLWEERCLREVVSAGTVSPLSLRDSLPLYLEHLSEALASNRKLDFKSVVAHDDKAARIGKRHGADRAGDKNYVLTEVIFEYHILREVIFQVLETNGQLTQIQRDIIFDSIEQAVNDAAVEFSEVHTDIQQTFVSTLTHDLKNPITSAKMNAQLILRNSDTPEPSSKSARSIVSSMNRLEAMIHDLLDASRLRAGEHLSLEFIQCDLHSVIREVVYEMSVMHGDRFILDSKEAVEGNWGSDGLRRAVENLVGNAVKYSTPETPITVSLRSGKTAVTVTVHNQGPPISQKEVSRLFQQYRRSKSAQEATKTGWGLGLIVVKGVVDAHKGKIRVESQEGKGTSFILEIPFAELAHVKNLRKSG